MALVSTDTVRVDGGDICGTISGNVRSFKGIPYAAPPVGHRRWRPPDPVVPWTGIRDASEYGAECPQTQYPAGSIYIRPLQKQSEDCLFINVWTTAQPGDRRPVYVWIHGGALTRGSGRSDIRDASRLAAKGPVVVSFNYRLGPLGYLAHPDLSAESPHGSSGNYGTLDQIAALRWVQQNIAAFGGDPACVTIGGESAGAWSVNTLLASPLAKDLFVRAIAQSGGRFARGILLHETRGNTPSAEQAGLDFARSLGADSLKALRAMPAEELVRVETFRTQENVDGWILPDEIRAIFARQEQNNVPVIVGSTADEGTAFRHYVPVPKTFDAFKSQIVKQYGEMADDFERAYRVHDSSDMERALLQAWRDTVFSMHMRSWARATAAAGSRAYLYHFSHVPPSPRRHEMGAYHAGDLPYAFDALRTGDPREAGFTYTEVDDRLAAQMSTYWKNFIMTGDPNGDSLPRWTPYDSESEPYLDFGDTITAGHHLYKTELDFQERVFSERVP